jgi:hypothetical protein
MYSGLPSSAYRLPLSVPVRLLARGLTLGMCVLIVSCICCMAYAFQTGDVSCEQYVQTFDSEMEARSRSGHEKEGLYSFYKVFLSYAEGFFRGTDSMSLGSEDQDELSGSIVAPGVVRQTGTHHGIIFGEHNGQVTSLGNYRKTPQ